MLQILEARLRGLQLLLGLAAQRHFVFAFQREQGRARAHLLAALDGQLRQRAREWRGHAHVLAFDVALDRPLAAGPQPAGDERQQPRIARRMPHAHGAGRRSDAEWRWNPRQRARPRIAAGCPGSGMRLPVSTSWSPTTCRIVTSLSR